jgi:hypothetical protein
MGRNKTHRLTGKGGGIDGTQQDAQPHRQEIAISMERIKTQSPTGQRSRISMGSNRWGPTRVTVQIPF